MANHWLAILTLIATSIFLTYAYYPIAFLLFYYFGTNSKNNQRTDSRNRAPDNIFDSLHDLSATLLQKAFALSHWRQKSSTFEISAIAANELENFAALSQGLSQPILIRGGLKDSQAVQEWNFDYFQKKYAEKEVLCVDDSTAENSNKHIRERLFISARFKTMSQIIENIRCGGKNYVSNVSEFLQNNPELIDELGIVGLIENIKKDACFSLFNYKFSQIFMGNSHSVSALHCAIGSNLFVNVLGHKRWYLIHPKYTFLMKPHLNEYGLFAFGEQDMFDPSDISQKIPHIDVTLDPGDVLFVPPWWWHAVSNESELTIGVANRIDVENRAYWASNRLFTFLHLRHGLGWAVDTPDEHILKHYVSVDESERASEAI